MKAAKYGDPGVVTLVERDIPEPQPDWLRIAVGSAGICGSDLHMIHGALGDMKGLQPGHEVSGVVAMVGDGVQIPTGTQVAVEPLHGCGTCVHCHSGRPNRCANHRIFGVSAKGGMAEFLIVPAHCVHQVAAELPSSIAALVEPMAVCVRAVRLAGVGIHDRVAILGAGSIGLVAIVAALAAGASEVYVSARHTHQHELALHLGATQVFDSGPYMLKTLGDQHIDVVVETVGGTASTLDESVALARSGGTIVMLGLFEGSPRMSALLFCTKELTMVGSNCYGREAVQGDFAVATELVARHSTMLAPIITHTFSLDQVVEAFATAADKANNSIKAQIQP
jgi:threonine dehydrogenase-like Zn-dependent dehydrogenase